MSTCAELIAVAARQIQDVSNRRWPSATLLTYLNHAIQEIVDKDPTSHAVTGNITLTAGTKQALPTGANYLLDVTRNMGTGATPGRAITPLNPQTLASVLPDWHTYPAHSEVRHVILDPKNPDVWYCFPPQPTGTAQKVQGVWSAYPTKVIDAGTAYPLGAEYEVQAIDYMIYRALTEETSIPNALAKANQFYEKFLQGLGVKAEIKAVSGA